VPGASGIDEVVVGLLGADADVTDVAADAADELIAVIVPALSVDDAAGVMVASTAGDAMGADATTGVLFESPFACKGCCWGSAGRLDITKRLLNVIELKLCDEHAPERDSQKDAYQCIARKAAGAKTQALNDDVLPEQ